MKKYLIDTNICIFYFKGKYNVNKKFKQIGLSNIYISEITVAELLFGAFNSKYIDKHLEEVRDITSLFTVVPIYPSLKTYASEKAKLQKQGMLIDDFDLLIGSTAVHNDMVLVTDNYKHLSRIEGINIENWVER